MKATSTLPPVITIDGGAGTGKGTVRRMIARVLKFIGLDSGVLYRSVALKALQQKVPLDDEMALIEIAKTLNVMNIDSRVFLDGKDQTKEIRSKDIGTAASKVAQYRSVRLALRGLQLSMQQWPGLVTDGRDQALIFDTPYRFFLVCAPEKRAKWRKKQFDQMGIPATYDEILADIIRRDESDTHNPANPLRSHPNAIVIDVTGSSSAKEVARLILCLSGLAQQRA